MNDPKKVERLNKFQLRRIFENFNLINNITDAGDIFMVEALL